MSLVRVFAYGSLIFSPELPERVRERRPAVLRGHRRAFNKRSGPRACARDEQLFPHLADTLPQRFQGPASLALGTLPGDAMRGVVLGYDENDADELFARLDQREGVWRDQPEHTWSYRPSEVALDTPDGAVEAVAWLSNPTGDWHEHALTGDEVVRILLHATPREVGDYARGVDYLLQTWRALREIGVEDPHLDDLIARLDPELVARR
ncbi:MAG: hypothetical protein EP330_10215 [Deltaproteobacteria bacterium]|nr:MAG: hypothetical protein EP330_10215 [Deltaproteobacteria bacterium]